MMGLGIVASAKVLEEVLGGSVVRTDSLSGNNMGSLSLTLSVGEPHPNRVVIIAVVYGRGSTDMPLAGTINGAGVEDLDYGGVLGYRHNMGVWRAKVPTGSTVDFNFSQGIDSAYTLHVFRWAEENANLYLNSARTVASIPPLTADEYTEEGGFRVAIGMPGAMELTGPSALYQGPQGVVGVDEDLVPVTLSKEGGTTAALALLSYQQTVINSPDEFAYIGDVVINTTNRLNTLYNVPLGTDYPGRKIVIVAQGFTTGTTGSWQEITVNGVPFTLEASSGADRNNVAIFSGTVAGETGTIYNANAATHYIHRSKISVYSMPGGYVPEFTAGGTSGDTANHITISGGAITIIGQVHQNPIDGGFQAPIITDRASNQAGTGHAFNQEGNTLDTYIKSGHYAYTKAAAVTYRSSPVERYGLFSWLKPEDLGVVGSNVTSWGVASGLKDYINGTFAGPTVVQSGAHKYAAFTGTERMESAVSTGGAPSERTIIAVVSPGVNKTQGMPIVGASTGTVGVLTTASLYPRVEEYGGTWQAVSGPTQMNLNQFNVVSATFSDVNNALAVARDLEPLTPVASNAGFALDRKLVLGGNGGSAGFIGGIAEVAIYNRVLSDAERESIIQYFKTKYGV